MKKTFFVLILTAAAIVGSYVAFAAESGNQDNMMMGGGMMDNGGGCPMMHGGMCRGCWHPMHQMMCRSSLAATEDGGAIVLMGNKLYKYDKDLNLVKETEIKIDWDHWKEMMKKHDQMMGQEQSSK